MRDDAERGAERSDADSREVTARGSAEANSGMPDAARRGTDGPERARRSAPRSRSAGSGVLEAFRLEPSGETLRRVFETYSGFLFRIARSWSRDHSTAEEVVNETLYRLTRSMPSEPIRKERAFLATVTKRAAKRIRRTHQRAVRTSDTLDTPSPPGVDPAILLDLERALETLPPHARDLLRLRHREGRTVSEIAASLGVSTRSVERHLASVHATLRQRIGTGYTEHFTLLVAPLRSFRLGPDDVACIRRAFLRARAQLSEGPPSLDADLESARATRQADRVGSNSTTRERSFTRRGDRSHVRMRLGVSIAMSVAALALLIVYLAREREPDTSPVAIAPAAVERVAPALASSPVVVATPTARSRGPGLAELGARLRRALDPIDWAPIQAELDRVRAQAEPPATVLRVRVVGEPIVKDAELVGRGTFRLLAREEVPRIDELPPGESLRVGSGPERPIVEAGLKDWIERDEVVTDTSLHGLVLVATASVRGYRDVRSEPFRLVPGRARDVTLRLSAERPRLVRVLDAITGAPVPRAYVDFVDLERDPSNAAARVSTDDDGRAVVHGLRETRHLVRVLKSGYPLVAFRTVEAEELEAGITLWLHPRDTPTRAGRILVEVHDVSGRPWPDVQVRYADRDARPVLGRTDGRGRHAFDVEGYGGLISIEASEDERASFEPTELAQLVDVMPGSSARVVLGRPRRDGVVRVRAVDATGRGIADARLTLAGLTEHRARTDASGTAVFSNVAAGRFALSHAATLSSATLRSSDVIEVGAGETVEHEIVLGNATITGRLQATRQPQLSVQLVTARPERRLVSTLMTDRAGHFAFDGLSPGKYVVRCATHQRGFPTFVERPVEITASTELVELETLDLDRYGRLVLDVVGSDGKPVRGTRGALSTPEGTLRLTQLRSGRRACELFVDVPAGTCTATIQAPGHRIATLEVTIDAGGISQHDVVLERASGS